MSLLRLKNTSFWLYNISLLGALGCRSHTMWWWTPLLGALLATWPASRFTICNLQYSDSFGCSQNLRWLLIFFQEACSNVTNLRGLLKGIYAKSPSFAKYSWKFWQNIVSHLMQQNVSGLANRGYAGDLLKGIFFLLGVTFSILLIIYFNTGGCYSKWGLGEILHWRRVHYFCQVYILQSPLLSFTTTIRPFKKQTNVRVTWDLL